MRHLTRIIDREIGDVTGWTTMEVYAELRDHAVIEKQHTTRRFIRSPYFPTKAMLVAQLKTMGYRLIGGFWYRRVPE